MRQTIRFCRHIGACSFHAGSFSCTSTCPMCWTTRAILDVDDPVVCTPSAAQLDVHFALNVHEHKTASETNRNDNQLCPEWPLKHTGMNLFRSAVDKHVKWPYNTRDGDDVERHWTEDLASFNLRHLQLLPLHHTTTLTLCSTSIPTISIILILLVVPQTTKLIQCKTNCKQYFLQTPIPVIHLFRVVTVLEFILSVTFGHFFWGGRIAASLVLFSVLWWMGILHDTITPSVLWLLVGWQERHPACKKTEWWDAGVVMCLGKSADLHMAQLMLLPLTISCSTKSRLILPFWCWLTR